MSSVEDRCQSMRWRPPFGFPTFRERVAAVFWTGKSVTVALHPSGSLGISLSTRSRTGEMTPEDVEEEMPRRPGRINLLSVGRFCYAKNYDNVPDICRRIRQDGVDACWYLVGFGETEVLVRERIAEAGMQEYVRLTGEKDNPYPYMLACDLYVQPSRYEGWPMTVLEARSLGKPVVLTDFPTARGIAAADGGIRIVPTDNEGCARALAEIARGIVKEKTK